MQRNCPRLSGRLIARNPFADCSVPVPKKTRHRETQAFSVDEIRLILRNGSAIKDSGARAGEITQLRGQDVAGRHQSPAYHT